MARDLPNDATPGAGDFQKVTESFLACKRLPFDSVLPTERIYESFSQHNSLFATNGGYSTAVVPWAFLGQV